MNSNMFGGIIAATTESRQTARSLIQRQIARHPTVVRSEARPVLPVMHDASTSTDDLEDYINKNIQSKEQKVLTKWMAKQQERAKQRALMAAVMQPESGAHQESDDDE